MVGPANKIEWAHLFFIAYAAKKLEWAHYFLIIVMADVGPNQLHHQKSISIHWRAMAVLSSA